MRLGVAAVISIAGFLLSPVIAEAKPKKVSNGCTAGQIQSPAAAGCLRQAESDILNDRPTVHALYCSSTGKILCCEYSGNTIVDHSCTVVGRTLPKGLPGDMKNLPTLNQQ